MFGWVFSFSIPYMINPDAGNLGGKVGFIFGSFAFVVFICGFFLFPETKGLSFSEIDSLYADHVSSLHFSSVIRRRRAEHLSLGRRKFQMPTGKRSPSPCIWGRPRVAHDM